MTRLSANDPVKRHAGAPKPVRKNGFLPPLAKSVGLELTITRILMWVGSLSNNLLSENARRVDVTLSDRKK